MWRDADGMDVPIPTFPDPEINMAVLYVLLVTVPEDPDGMIVWNNIFEAAVPVD